MDMTASQILALLVVAALLTIVFIVGGLFWLSHRGDDGYCAPGCGCLLLGTLAALGLLILIAAFLEQ